MGIRHPVPFKRYVRLLSHPRLDGIFSRSLEEGPGQVGIDPRSCARVSESLMDERRMIMRMSAAKTWNSSPNRVCTQRQTRDGREVFTVLLYTMFANDSAVALIPGQPLNPYAGCGAEYWKRTELYRKVSTTTAHDGNDYSWSFLPRLRLRLRLSRNAALEQSLVLSSTIADYSALLLLLLVCHKIFCRC